MDSKFPIRLKDGKYRQDMAAEAVLDSSGRAPDSVEAERASTNTSDEEVINDQKIEETLARIHRLILKLVGSMSTMINMDRFSWPPLADMHIWYPDCYNLFREALDFAADESLDSVFRRLECSLDEMPVYLRALIAGNVYYRILAADYPDLPFFSKRWIDLTFDPLMKRMDIEQSVQLKQIATKALSKQILINKKLSSLPRELSEKLCEALDPLLISYKSPDIDREPGRARRRQLEKQYGRSIADIYKGAIELRKALSRKEFGYSFFWVPAGEEFDETIMDAEVNLRRVEFYEPAKGKQVVATLVPGICRNETHKECPSYCLKPEREENIILRALVYLK